MSTVCVSRATSASAAVLGPGIGSARSKLAWSSVWQKYWLRNSSGRQTRAAPRPAASTMRARARFRLSSGSVEQRICTRPILKVLGAATVRLLLHGRQEVAEQAIPDRARRCVVAIGVGEDARAALRPERVAHVVGVLAHPGGDGLAFELDVELQAERPRAQPEGLVAADRRRREVHGAGRQIVGVAVPVENRRLSGQ